MHLLLIHQAFAALDEPGGTRHYELARYLARRGHRVTIIASPVSYLTGAPPQPPPFSEKMGGDKGGGIIALIKPQFEAGRADVSKGDGVIRNPEIHRQVLTDVLAFAQNEGFGVRGLMRSPLLGPKGNVEFLAWLILGAEGQSVENLIESALKVV